MNASPLLVPILNKLRRVRTSGAGFSAECPGHEDRANSLSVSESGGKILIHCHAGCSPEKVIAAAGAKLADLFEGDAPASPPSRQPKPAPGSGPARVASHFALPDGSLAEHWRQDRTDGTKAMWWTRDGKLGLRGYPLDQLPLYRMDDPAHDGDAVIVVEGEKAADALREPALAYGYLVVGTVTGASAIPCDDSLRPLLGRHVALWPDHDAPGRSHMDRIAYRLAVLGEWPFMVPCLSLPPKGDAADAVALGLDLGELLGAAALWNEGVLPDNEPGQPADSPSAPSWAVLPV